MFQLNIYGQSRPPALAKVPFYCYQLGVNSFIYFVKNPLLHRMYGIEHML